MNRRGWIKTLAGLAGASLLGRRAAADRPALIIQESPPAGFQCHAGGALWPQLTEGDALEIRREPESRHDRKAVLVLWRGDKLGYVPRAENAAVAQMLDRGAPLTARVSRLRESLNPGNGCDSRW